MTLKSVANCLYTIFLKEYIEISIYSWPNMVTLYEQGWMGGNKWNFDYFLIKFNDFDQINIGRITFWSILLEFQ